MKTTLLALLLAATAYGQPAAAQRRIPCAARTAFFTPYYLTPYYAGLHHTPRTCRDTVDRPFAPSRWGMFVGAAGVIGQRGALAGAELEGSYRLGARLQGSVAGTAALPTRINSNLGVRDAAKPMLGIYSLTARTTVLLLDGPRLRTGLLTGAGVAVATLADRSQQVIDRGQDPNCGCEPSTHAKTLASTVGVVGLAGATATYKLRPDLWLTAKTYYQQWASVPRFGGPSDLSPWVISLGLTMPDRWRF